MISIVIPALNEEKFLPQLLSSLVRQTNKNFEVIVVDGNSTDRTNDVARSFQKKLPRLTVLTSPAGVSRQRNLGASRARGNWLVFIDADNVLLPYAIEQMVQFIRLKNPVIFTTWARSDSETVNDAMVMLFINMAIEGALLLHRPASQGGLTGITKKVFIEVGGFDEAISWGEDYDLTKRVCGKDKQLSIIRETLYVFSMRRMRNTGTLKLARIYARVLFSVLVMNKTPSDIPGYVTGGHPYNNIKRKPIRPSVIRQFNSRIKALVKELFG